MPGKYTGTIGYEVETDNNGNGTPNWGDLIKAVVTTDCPTPWARLTCFQNDRLVAEGWANLADGFDQNHFGLYSPQWTGGDADCTFDLLPNTDRHTRPIATVDFQAAA